ncbi:hypothetical protein QFZ79_000907 [Arthrobacter sp. V4I6]|uniref:hypothetical protein n=1 Tax=Arthrobacter sp. V4I6 TaxID=3042281 RepID=UPI0027837ACA|nr:hypothetical protein [Arthrobacter sp. V4I6]MDQ0852796.1 hypothetical protein [Arthrobacter sp. V4I6]
MAGLVKGRVPWPVLSTVVACVLLGVLVVLTVAVLVLRSRTAHKRTRVDKAAVHMGRGTDLDHLSTKGATATAVRLGVENFPGVRLGRSVAGKRPLGASWEDMLAASLNSSPVTQVYTWLLTRPHDEAPAELLRTAGYDLLSDMVMGHIREPEKQRAGVYGTARQMVSCLTDREVSRWVTPLRDTTVDMDPRPQFVPEDFVRGKGTLYSLSREGVGTAGPLVTALTVASWKRPKNTPPPSPAAV